jgi:hypothetical protein
MKQGSSASLSFDAKKKPTRREKFLGEMDKVVPWEALLALIELSYPTSGRRGPAVRLERNVRTQRRVHRRRTHPKVALQERWHLEGFCLGRETP